VPDFLHAIQDELPNAAAQALNGLADQLHCIRIEIDKIEAEIKDWHRTNEANQRLATIPGIGPITASAIVAAVPDATLFKSSRQFAAWLGLTPKSHSSGGKERLVGISKQGDGYIRRLLVLGATAVTRFTRQGHGIKIWASKLLDRKPSRLVTVALANKMALIVWALLTRNQSYAAAA
jgi:transposase